MQPSPNRLGLALSGGGFRATLYHLGLIRFLRDAGILSRITHITSVSGGSIMAAHLVLNWDRYNGSPDKFDAAAAELLSFIELDVRNRITRRFPLTLPLRWPRRLLGLSNRHVTRTGLLEYHYEKFLYGQASLFDLPEKPELHILATNLSEGCLCSFNRNGLLMVRRQDDNSVRIDSVHTGLATVAMAVTASSAFPAFFPPLELTGHDVGASAGKFGRQAYTDGGVYDNLGVRMIHILEGAHLLGELGGVLVSDVGKRMEVDGSRRAGGVIRTALRAADIVMDRVWQLEIDKFLNTPGFVFAPITDVVEPAEDPTALHPEIQRQVPNIRTDLDRFSPLEISSLVQHGYCVARKVCRAHPELFGADLPNDSPWNPIPDTGESAAVPPTPARLAQLLPSAVRRMIYGVKAKSTTVRDRARALQASALRRIWSTLLTYRDWTSYIYVPLLVPIITVLPYFAVKYYERSRRVSQLVESLSQGSRDLGVMSELLEGPIKPFVGVPAEEVAHIEPLNFEGFEVLQDSRILDLRPWHAKVSSGERPSPMVYGYRRLKVRKKATSTGNQPFRVKILATSPLAQIRFPAQKLQPRLRKCVVTSADAGVNECHWEMWVDFHKVLPGDNIDLIYEHYSPGEFLQDGIGSTTFSFTIQVDTAEVTRWFLMPQGREYRNYRILQYEVGKPEKAEEVRVVTEYLADDSTILAYKLISVKAGYTYEVTWEYK